MPYPFLLKLFYYLFKKKQNISSENEEDINNLEPLSPRLLDKKNSLLSKLNWAIKNENVTNIAITGAYGSGKSSLIKTFKKYHPENYYIDISLASFKGEDIEEKTIELSLLQQILYKEGAKKFSESKIQRITSLSPNFKWFAAVIVCLWGIGFAEMFYSKLFYENNVIKTFILQYSRYDKLIDLVFIICTFLLVLQAIIFFTRLRLKSLRVSGFNGEMELEGKKDISLFNRYLDELIYFFEKTEYNVVFLEDLDRIKNCQNILSKLRELNQLLNKSSQLKGRKLTFIYAVKDELFAPDIRTKFFDFIIPIIPIINYSNSKKFLKDKLADTTATPVTEEFINAIYLFVDDMRILVNVCNEFYIYRDRLGNTLGNLSPDKLLAMILYKNLNPQDFEQLIKKKSRINKAFNAKSNFIEDLINQIDLEINSYEERIEAAQSITAKSIDELRAVYILAMMGKTSLNTLNSKDRHYGLKDINELKENEGFDILKTSGFRLSSNDSNFNLKFERIEKDVDQDYTYNEREELLTRKLSDNNRKLMDKLVQLKAQKNELENLSLKTILNQTNNLSQLSEVIEQNELLQYLLTSGYIEEDFESYHTYFYEGNLTSTDKDFILAVKNKKHTNLNYKLIRVKEVSEELMHEDFSKDAVLNLDLINYLIDNYNPAGTNLDIIFKQFAEPQEKAKEYFSQLPSLEKLEKIIPIIAKNNRNFWSQIENTKTFEIAFKLGISRVLIKTCNQATLKSINTENALSIFISRQKTFLWNITEARNDREKFFKNLKSIDVQFYYLEMNSKEFQFPQEVLDLQLYKLSLPMIKLIMQEKLSDYSEEGLLNANLTYINQSNIKLLTKRVNEDLKEYFENVVVTLESSKSESSEKIYELLNNSSLDEVKKMDYLKKQKYKINQLDDIEEELWETALKTNVLLCSLNNLQHYFHIKQEIGDLLIDFVNQNTSVFIQKTPALIDGKELENFEKSILFSNEIGEIAFQGLIHHFKTSFTDIDLSSLPLDRLRLLVEKQIVEFNPTNLNYLNGPQKVEFTIPNIGLLIGDDSYLSDLEISEIKELIKSDRVSTINKTDLIKWERNRIIKAGLGLVPEIAEFISNSVIELSHEEALKFLRTDIDLEYKLKLLKRHISIFEQSELLVLLGSLPAPFYQLAFSGSRFEIQNTSSEIKGILLNLRFKKIVSSYKLDNDLFKVNNKHFKL